jgi:hypothetical protein
MSSQSGESMDWYRISKYDPRYRDEEGRYLRDESTSVSDIGRSFDGVALDVATYLGTETAYVRSVGEFMADAGVTSLRVASLEPPPDLDPLWNFGLPDAEELAPLANQLRDGMDLEGAKLDQVLRLNLRNMLWCELVRPDRLSVDVGHDYYLHVGTTAPSERAMARTHELGLFVDEWWDPRA